MLLKGWVKRLFCFIVVTVLVAGCDRREGGIYSAVNARCEKQSQPLSFINISGIQVRSMGLPPDDRRMTVAGFDLAQKSRIMYEIPVNETLDSLIFDTDSGHLYAIKKSFRKDESKTPIRYISNFIDLGQIYLSINQEAKSLAWKSLLTKKQLDLFYKNQISVLNMKYWMGTILLEFHMPISKENFTTKYDSVSVTYNIESGEFSPSISEICELVAEGKGVKQPQFDGHSKRNQSVPEGESHESRTVQDLQPGV